MKNYLWISQYGDKVHASTRKELLKKCGRSHASKMYVDVHNTGKSQHIGYVIGGLWYTRYEISPIGDK